VLKKRGKFATNTLLRHADIVMFVLWYFILAHPVVAHASVALIYRAGQKSDILSVFKFSLLLDVFANVRNFCFFMQINCNLVTVVGLIDDERCLIRNTDVEQHCGSERITKMFSNIRTHLKCK